MVVVINKKLIQLVYAKLIYSQCFSYYCNFQNATHPRKRSGMYKRVWSLIVIPFSSTAYEGRLSYENNTGLFGQKMSKSVQIFLKHLVKKV